MSTTVIVIAVIAIVAVGIGLVVKNRRAHG